MSADEDMALLEEVGHLSFTAWITETKHLRERVRELEGKAPAGKAVKLFVTRKDEELTFVLRVSDPKAASRAISPILHTMLSPDPVQGVQVIASSRSNVMEELDRAEDLLGRCLDYLGRECLGDPEAEELLDEGGAS